MTEVPLARLLPASLHQAIADELPQRLDFYENWLTGEGLRDGSIGLAPMMAVVSFLRTEGVVYDAVMSRAGLLAADWTLESLPPLRKRYIAWLPRGLRTRAAVRLAAEIARSVSRLSRVSARLRGKTARVEVKSSVFCSVRETHATPLCGFYVALTARVLSHFGIAATASVEQCQAVSGGPSCIIAIDLGASGSAPVPAIAA
ncbi:MAG: hypothetical protein ABI634_02015 [Acidobacteriota bacterium]